MNDQKRAALVLLVQNGVTLAVAFGAGLTAEQTGGIIAIANSAMTVFMLFWKNGQEPETANPP